MGIKIIKVGILETNCYFVADEKSKEAFIVDPGFNAEKILFNIDKSYKVKYILITHAHYDHISAVNKVKEATGAKIVCSVPCEDVLNDPMSNLSLKNLFTALTHIEPDILIEDNGEIEFGDDSIKAIYTPGHSKGDCSYIYKNCIFVGDFIFKETIGNVSFINSSFKAMNESLKRISLLEKDYILYPGHDVKTTLNHEKENNPYLIKAMKKY